MNKVRTLHYIILATDMKTGQRFQCFTWLGSKADGIARAYQEAKIFDRNIKDVTAEPIKL